MANRSSRWAQQFILSRPRIIRRLTAGCCELVRVEARKVCFRGRHCGRWRLSVRPTHTYAAGDMSECIPLRRNDSLGGDIGDVRARSGGVEASPSERGHAKLLFAALALRRACHFSRFGFANMYRSHVSSASDVKINLRSGRMRTTRLVSHDTDFSTTTTTLLQAR